jgi:hypothetical protein
MSLPEVFRSRVPAEREAISIITRGAAAEARVDAQAQVVRAVIDSVSDVTDQALIGVSMLATRTETLAARSPLAQAALASLFDQGVLELQVCLHQGAEAIRRSSGGR